MSDITRILDQVASGDASPANELLPLVYDELRHLAAAKLAHEKPGQTLQATALVHEAYLRLAGGEMAAQHWDNRRHFYAAAAEAMRRILIGAGRRRKCLRRGGEMTRLEFGDAAVDPASVDLPMLLTLDEALTKLAEADPDSAESSEKTKADSLLSEHRGRVARGGWVTEKRKQTVCYLSTAGGGKKADSLLSERRGRVARGGWVTENGGKLTR